MATLDSDGTYTEDDQGNWHEVNGLGMTWAEWFARASSLERYRAEDNEEFCPNGGHHFKTECAYGASCEKGDENV